MLKKSCLQSSKRKHFTSYILSPVKLSDGFQKLMDLKCISCDTSFETYRKTCATEEQMYSWPRTTWVWTVWVHGHSGFFQQLLLCAAQSEVGWISRFWGSQDGEGQFYTILQFPTMQRVHTGTVQGSTLNQEWRLHRQDAHRRLLRMRGVQEGWTEFRLKQRQNSGDKPRGKTQWNLESIWYI